MNIANQKFTSVAPTVDTNAYAAGDLIGGKLTFANALGAKTCTGYVASVKVDDAAAQNSDLALVLFAEDPTGTTFTDNAAFDPADTDLAKIVAVIPIPASGARYAFNDNAVMYVGSLFVPVHGRTATGLPSRTLYGALVSGGTPTYAAVTDVRVTIAVAQD